MRQAKFSLLSFMLLLLAALVIDLLPSSSAFSVWRPDWTLMILMYWLMCMKDRVSFFLCALWGVFFDCVVGTPMGFHALIYTALAMMIVATQSVLRHGSQAKKIMWGILYLTICAALKEVLLLFTGYGLSGYDIFHCLTNILCWPFLLVVLDAAQYRLHRIRKYPLQQ